MNLPKKLEKLRDDLPEIDKYGFNAACEILLPEIEKMREALGDISVHSCDDCDCNASTALDALKQWQEFVECE